jgi:hypothetical protein
MQETRPDPSILYAEIYTHVSNEDFMKIKNPLDQILGRKEDSL